MRGVGDFGRGGAGLGGDGERFLGQPGSDGGASWRGRDGSARRATGGRQDGAGAHAPQTGDERSDDFQRRLGGAIESLGRGRAGTDRDGERRGGEEGPAPTGAAILFALLRPGEAGPPADPARADPAAAAERAAGRGSAAAAGEADQSAAADRDGSAHPASAPRSLRVLAASEPSAEGVPASSAFGVLGRALPEAVAPDAWAPNAARAERAAARIEAALRADAAPDGPVTIAVPVDPGVDGLAGLTVTLTPAGLDIVLDRVGGAAVSDGLAAAAQDLVVRLQKRFPRGSVRVLDRAERADAAEGAPLPGVVRPQT